MRTISQVVARVIGESPFLEEVLGEGIANHAEITRHIKGEVEKRLLEDVSEAAVSMALHRLSKDLRGVVHRGDVLKTISDITVRSNLVEYIFPSTRDVSSIMTAVSRVAKKRNDSFVNFSRGLYQSLLIVNREFEKEIERAVSEATERITDLSAITMRLPKESVAMPGVYYPLLKAIAREGISFVEVMSVDTEFSIIFNDTDIDRAFSAIKRITS